MSYTGGDILEITYNHPTVGQGTLFPKAGEDSTFDRGGYRSADEDENVAGNGDMIDVMTNRRWSAEMVVANDQNEKDEMGQVLSLVRSTVPAVYTITVINGTVWKGKGKPVGDLQEDVKNATFSLKLGGGGKMEQVV